MKNKFIKILYSALTCTALVFCSSCMMVREDEPTPCPRGLEVRFIYDYNLERANAFPAQVDCLTLHVFDEEGNFVRTLDESGEALADEGYRMRIDDLPEGRYRLVAYGGATCGKASITHTAIPAEGTKESDLGMKLNEECLEPENPKGHLHDHFYGSAYAEVVEAPRHTQVTVEMMKNTNNFRILLQNLNYKPIEGDDYDFEIIDDNTLFDVNNDLINNGSVTYTPWDKGSISTGKVPVDGQNTPKASVSSTRVIGEVQMGYADLSTSRLMMKRNPVLRVYYKPTGKKIIELPLKNYLLALRSGHYSWAGDQEFLDRKSDWQLYFFLNDNNTWHDTVVRVEDWYVRINDLEI